MKILLLGEFSGFHTTLRDGLRVLGHGADVVGTGDGTKAIPVDWNIGSHRTGTMGMIERIAKAIHFTMTAPHADVIQLINPHVFPRGAGLNDHLIRRLRGRMPNMFLSACGDDALFVGKGIRALRYNPIDDAMRIDLGLERHPLANPDDLRWNRELAAMCDGVIPVMYEYQVAYADEPHRLASIPLPVNVDKIPALRNRIGDKLVVMHGAGRPGFKGSRHILAAFNLLEKRHPDRFEFVHVTNLPIDRYLELMKRVNVVVDQTNGYSCGMNALFALAMGKIVLGGAEPEARSLYDGGGSPVRNILPDAADIAMKLEELLDLASLFPRMGDESRQFVERHHHYLTVADRYVTAWTAARKGRGAR